MPLNISHKRIWTISAPLIAANLSTPLLGMVDTAVVGHLDSPIYLGAIALGSMLITFIFWSFGFLRMVTTGQTAQANTKNSANSPQKVLIQSSLLAIIIAAIILLFHWPIKLIAFQFINGSEAVVSSAQSYFDIRIWSAPATLLNYVILGWLIGKESSRSALIITLLINSTNIVLDLLFVQAFNMKTEGVALASVIAEFSGLLLGLYLIQKNHFEWQINLIKQAWQDLIQERYQFKTYANFMIRTLLLLFAFSWFTNQGAKINDLTLSTNMVLMNFIVFTSYVLDGIATSTEVFSGKAIGLRDAKLFTTTLRMTGIWCVIVASLFSLNYALFHQQLIGLLTNIPNVAANADKYALWMIIAPLVSVWCYLLDALFFGASLGREVRNSVLFAVLICYLPSWYCLQTLGNDGLWAALMVFFISRSVGLIYYLPSVLKRFREPIISQ